MSTKFLAGIDLTNQQLVNLADGSAPTDGVNLQQLQSAIRGMNVKTAARAASTANINLSAPGTTIDGVTMATNDRFLAKNETAGETNGIYVWNGSGVPATRALDNDSAAEMVSAAVFVTEGTVNANRMWVQTVDPTITLGTTALVWSEFGGGVTYSAGNGITFTGTVISVDADTGILVTGSGVSVDPSVVPGKYAATIGNGSSTSIAVTHNLGTKDVTWSLRQVSDDAFVQTDAVATSTTVLTLTFAVAPASSSLRIVVHG